MKVSRARVLSAALLAALAFSAISSFYQILGSPQAFSVNPSSSFTYGYSEKVELIAKELRAGVPYILNLTDEEIGALKLPLDASHIVTFTLSSGERYSIFETKDGELVGVLWQTEGGLIDKIGEDTVSLRCIENVSEGSVRVMGNSTYIQNTAATIYRLESSLMPEALVGSIYRVDLDASMTWRFLGSDMATVHASATFYVEYGVAVISGNDHSYDWTRSSVTRCSFTHGINGVGTVSASVRADGHYMYCLIVASKHANIGAWHSVDAWLNLGPPGGYGYEYGKFQCKC